MRQRGSLSNVQRQTIPKLWSCNGKHSSPLSLSLQALSGAAGQLTWEINWECRGAAAQRGKVGQGHSRLARTADNLKGCWHPGRFIPERRRLSLCRRGYGHGVCMPDREQPCMTPVRTLKGALKPTLIVVHSQCHCTRPGSWLWDQSRTQKCSVFRFYSPCRAELLDASSFMGRTVRTASNILEMGTNQSSLNRETQQVWLFPFENFNMFSFSCGSC